MSAGLPTSPVHLFDALIGRGAEAARRGLAESVEIVALPGEVLGEDLRPGDLVVQRALGEGGLARVATPGEAGAAGLAAGRRLPPDRLVVRPLAGEAAPGWAGETVAADGPLDPHALIHPGIDVEAQRALARMSRGAARERRAANGLFAAVRAEELAGIFQENQQVPAKRAERSGIGWWQVIPAGEDAVLLLEPGAPTSPPPTGPAAPLVSFRRTIATVPARLDPALVRAWESFERLRGGGATACPAPGGALPVIASTIASMRASETVAAAPLVLANIVPRVCVGPPPGLSQEGIVLSAIDRDGTASDQIDFEVSIDGGAPVKVAGSGFVPIPAGRRPLPVKIRALPKAARHWPFEGHFAWRGPGDLTFLKAPPELRPRRLPGSAAAVVAVLSRVRNATDRVLAELAQVPDSRKTGHHPIPWPPAAWDTPSLADLNYIASPPVANGALRFDVRTVDPDTEDLVLEVADITAPKLVAVSWPRRVGRGAGAGPTPFLVYFHPTVAQNLAAGFYVGKGLGTYPFGWDYLFYGLWRYVNYMGDPLLVDPFAKGLPYQIAAAGKDAVLVLPSNAHKHEVGEFLDAAVVDDVLREIQAFMFRRAGNFTPSGLGRTALGAFSDGNDLAAQFLDRRANRRHAFYLNTLQELYNFDGPNVGAWVGQALAWAGAGAAQDKRIRVYTRRTDPSYRQLLGTTAPGAGLGVTDSADGRRTAAVLPNAAWLAVHKGKPPVPRALSQAHQLISALMLTDALRRSGF